MAMDLINIELNDDSYSSVKDVRDNVDIVRQFAATCVGNVSPVCAFFGGIIGQEVLKACSGMSEDVYPCMHHIYHVDVVCSSQASSPPFNSGCTMTSWTLSQTPNWMRRR